jgi:hypothetical protein
LFNAETLRGADEVILAESVIDALSCIELLLLHAIEKHQAKDAV